MAGLSGGSDSEPPGAGSVLEGLSFTVGRTGPLSGLGRAERLVTAHLAALGAHPVRSAGTGPSDDLHMRLHGPEIDVDARMTGWGGIGSGPFTETLAQARCGLMAVHGRANGRPARLGVDVATVAGSVLAVQGLLAAVLGGLRGSDVRHAEIGVAPAALLMIGQYLAGATADEDPETITPIPDDLHARPPFVSADGVTFEMETLDADPWQRFWTELGADPTAVGRSWRPFMLRYARGVAPLSPALHATVGRTDFARIRAVADRTGMSICRIRTLRERRADPDVGRAPWSVTPIGAAAGPMRAPDGPLPLSGLRVVESCRRVQGPLAGQLLAMLGAHVIRVEPPGGDPLRGMPPMAGDSSARFVALNRGKEIVEVDIKSAAGRKQMYDLVGDADVFVHNWAPGKAAKLGLDSADMARVNPGLVYAYPSGWGDVLGDTPPIGTDFMVQAWSGVADVASGPGRQRPSLMTLLDLLGGLLCTESVLAGLIARARTGRGRLVGTSLLSASTVLLADELDRSQRAARGCGAAPRPVDTVFETADRPLAVSACTATARQHLMEACGIHDADDRPADAEERLAAVLATRPAGEWAERLRAAGVPCEVVATDLARLAGDDDIATALDRDPGCAVVTSPWSFR